MHCAFCCSRYRPVRTEHQYQYSSLSSVPGIALMSSSDNKIAKGSNMSWFLRSSLRRIPQRAIRNLRAATTASAAVRHCWLIQEALSSRMLAFLVWFTATESYPYWSMHALNDSTCKNACLNRGVNSSSVSTKSVSVVGSVADPAVDTSARMESPSSITCALAKSRINSVKLSVYSTLRAILATTSAVSGNVWGACPRVGCRVVVRLGAWLGVFV